MKMHNNYKKFDIFDVFKEQRRDDEIQSHNVRESRELVHRAHQHVRNLY